MSMVKLASALVFSLFLAAATLGAQDAADCSIGLSAGGVENPAPLLLSSSSCEGWYRCEIACPGAIPPSYWGYFTSLAECCSYSDANGCYSSGAWGCDRNGFFIWECPISDPPA